MTKPDPFRYFKTNREIIRLAVMLYVRFPLSLRNVEDLLHERGIDVSHEAVRYWWHRFGPRSLQARTRIQAALPITVRDRVRIWTAPLRGLRAHLSGVIENVSVLQTGGPVCPGVADDTLAEAVAKKLGLAVADVWHTDRRRTADIGHWLMKLAGAIGKLVQDIALMAQQGVDEVQIKGAGGSSAMAHKQNPVRAEVLRTARKLMDGIVFPCGS